MDRRKSEMAKWELVDTVCEDPHFGLFNHFELELHGQPVLSFGRFTNLTELEHHELCLRVAWALRLADAVAADPHIKSVQVRMILEEFNELFGGD
jgi:hypothetical protein